MPSQSYAVRGAVEVLHVRYMMEEPQLVSAGGMISYHEFHIPGLSNRDEAGGIISREVPLLFYAAMGEHRQDRFRYLLSRHDTDVNATFQIGSELVGDQMKPLHLCASKADVP